MNYYNRIKEELINNEIYKRVKDYSKNRSDLNTYYNVGKLIVEAQGGEKRAKYGDGLIKEYSRRLTQEIGKKYSERNLRNMRQFYLLFRDDKWNAVRTDLSWTHYRELLFIDDMNKINYYVNISIEQHLSYRELHNKIKNNEYERIDNKVKEKMMTEGNNKIQDFIKHPILIKNKYHDINISEKILKQLILEDLDYFLKELGTGFSYIETEYKIKMGNSYHYIDMLLFNYSYNCFVVIEFKITELKAQHIGQIKQYMNYIDRNVKNINQDSTIGIIICRKYNQFVMEYCSDDRIFETTYILN